MPSLVVVRCMARRLLVVTFIIGAAALAFALRASAAAPVHHCGNINSGLRNLRTQNVTCRSGRRLVLDYEHCHGAQCTVFRGYRCSYRGANFRCAKGHKVIRWTVG